eukprot:CAMPEP_0118966326 /NCGR_PEP_ID=MMETSP1173-20130426/3792_1 /TAXON_ID=1034831 /ORGANISM="Rhizochromulina marina cf, Strain CCMP1243" /LENGTH=32 /DNA_ID= /DNA_START= /DNA_END= /DNA_ORIENTATION=
MNSMQLVEMSSVWRGIMDRKAGIELGGGMMVR